MNIFRLKNILRVLLIALQVSTSACAILRRMDGAEHTEMIMSLTFSSDNTTLMGTRDHDIVLWEAETGRFVQRLVGHKSVVSSVAFSPDGRLVVSASDDGSIKLWDVRSGNELRQLAPGVPGRKSVYEKMVNVVAFAPDGRTILSGGNDGNLNVWNASSGMLVQSLEEKPGVQSLGFGKLPNLAFVGNSRGAIDLWDLEKGLRIRTFVHDEGSFLESLSVSTDGSMLLSVCLDSVKLWEVQTGKLIRTFNELGKEYYTPTQVAFSPAGDFAYVGDYGYVYVWDLKTGDRVRKLKGERVSHIKSLAVSPNGKYVVVGDIFGDITRWQVGSGISSASFTAKGDQNDKVEYR